MRPFLPLALMVPVLLAGCPADRSGGVAATTPPVAEAAVVTLPDAPAAASAPVAQAQEAEAATSAEAARLFAGAWAAETPAAPPQPEAVKSPGQIACGKTGGRFAMAGNSTRFVRARETRVGGKSCRRETDCEGFCLARSRSCSPITPVLGCQESLTRDGLRVTKCVG
jgi:hypothetical protein